jgi:hypothetical protein
MGSQHGRHERWGRMVKRSGMAGELGTYSAGQLGELRSSQSLD